MSHDLDCCQRTAFANCAHPCCLAQVFFVVCYQCFSHQLSQGDFLLQRAQLPFSCWILLPQVCASHCFFEVARSSVLSPPSQQISPVPPFHCRTVRQEWFVVFIHYLRCICTSPSIRISDPVLVCGVVFLCCFPHAVLSPVHRWEFGARLAPTSF